MASTYTPNRLLRRSNTLGSLFKYSNVLRYLLSPSFTPFHHEPRFSRLQNKYAYCTKSTEILSATEDAPLAERQLTAVLDSNLLSSPNRMPYLAGTHYQPPPPISNRLKESSTPDLIRQTLLAFIKKLQIMSPSDAVTEVRSRALGAQVFSWMTITAPENRKQISWDMQALAILANLMIVEENEQHLWEWLEDDVLSRSPAFCAPTAELLGFLSWTGRLAGRLVEVHLLRALDGCGDPALRCVLQFFQMKNEYPPARAINSAAVISGFSNGWKRASEKRSMSKTSAALFDACLDAMRPYAATESRERLGIQISYAQLQLLHPVRPDPQYSLDVLREYDTHRTSRPYRPRNLREAGFLNSWAKLVALTLRNMGRVSDAQWVDQLVGSTLKPSRRRLAQGDRPPKGVSFRTTASFNRIRFVNSSGPPTFR